MEKTDKANLPLTLTVPEVADILRINKTAAYQLAARKDFPAVKIGKRIIVPRDGFFRWLENEGIKDSLTRD